MPPSSAAAPALPLARRGPTGPLDGVVVLDLATFGPAARCTRLLADYGATVVKVGAVAGSGVETPRTPYYLYSGSRHLRHVSFDLKAPAGRDAFLDAGARCRRRGGELPARAWSTGWASASRRCARSTPG